MSTEVIVNQLQPGEVSTIIGELKKDDIIVGRDFDFYYHPDKYDWETGESKPKHTKFVFHNDAISTMFILRWC